MGNGSSACSSRKKMRSMATVKLIQLNGELKEFYVPVKVNSLLNKDSSDSFICNSDDMEFDGFVKAINGDEELQVGQLYFELPVSKLTWPLQAEEMASLAVKATVALRKSRNNNVHNETGYLCCYGGSTGFNSSRVDPGFVFYESISSTKTEQQNENIMVSVKKKERMLGNYISGGFAGKLSVIREDDY